MDDNVIRVCEPTIDDSVISEIGEVLKKGWFGNGPKVKEFEDALALYTRKKFAVACNSGTSALDMALKVYNIKGGELITTPMTFVSDAIVGEWNGMDVTFADIDEDTLCLDPDSLVVTENTKAIIGVDSHGRLCDWERIREKATINLDSAGLTRHTPLLIEDAAHAMYTPGVGEHSDITMFSFQAVKTMPTADGGALITDDENIAKALKKISWLGIEKTTYDRSLGRKYTWDYDITTGNGIKSYMTDYTATLALSQLKRLDEMLAHRRAIQSVYNEAFRDIPEIKLPVFSHTVQYYTMQCEDRDKLSEDLAEQNIVTSVHFKPLSEMTYWKKAIKRPLPVTERVWKKLLTLPCHDALTWQEVETVIKAVRNFYGK